MATESVSDSTENKTSKKETSSAGATKKEFKLSELRVADLRAELESRGLDKTGVKAALVERLRKSLEDEGKNPEEFTFEIASEAAVVKKSKRGKESLSETKASESDNVENDQDSDDDEEDKQPEESINENGESGEILQLSLDDREATLDGKEGMDTSSKVSDTEDNNTADSSCDLIATDEMNAEGKSTVIDDSEEVAEKSDDKCEEGEIETKTSPKPETEVKAAKPAETVAKTAVAKNIWITGLSSATRAADLKTLFSKQGKVVSVKIVTNAKQVSGDKKYYGFITMSTSKDAAKAVEALNNTELNEQVVSLELTAHQPGTLLKKACARPGLKKVKAVGDSAKAALQKTKKEDSKPETEEEKEKEDRGRRDRDRERRSREPRDYRDYRSSFRRPFGFRYRGRGRGFSYRERMPVESFRRPFGRKPFYGRMPFRPPIKSRYMGYRMRDDRLSRDRYREREMRESERRREEAFHHKMIERKQREEAYRLEREKVQLRIEREMLERERAEILKLEREKQRLEREKLEREKEKLRRQTQMREAQKRPFPGPPSDVDSVWEKDKRPRHYENRYPSYPSKPPSVEGRQDYRDPPQVYNRHKFEARPEPFDRDPHAPSTSRGDFKYGKDKADTMRDHDERRVYKRNYFREEPSRGYPPREPERYQPQPPPPRDDRFKPRMHDGARAPRGRGGGRRMPPSYY